MNTNNTNQQLYEDPDTVEDRNGDTYVTCGEGPTIAWIIWRPSNADRKPIGQPKLTFVDGRKRPRNTAWHTNVRSEIENEVGYNYEELVQGRIWPNKKITSTYQSRGDVMDRKRLVEKLFKDVDLNITQFDFEFGDTNGRWVKWPSAAPDQSTPKVKASPESIKTINHLIQKMHMANPVEKVRLRKQIKALQHASGIQDKQLDFIPIPQALSSFEKQFGSVAAARFAKGAIAEESQLEEDKIRVYNKTLEPNLWGDEMTLNEDVRLALLKVGKDFYESTDLTSPIIDILMIGSSANYNWTKESDIDVHIVVDISKEGINPKYIRKFMDGLGAAWNNNHEIEVKGHPVEVYIQDQTAPNSTPESAREGTAIYSLVKNAWVVKPEREKLSLDKEKIKTKYRAIKDQVEELISNDDYTGLKALMKKIRNYRNAGLKEEGEFGTENIVFKALRHTGILEKLSNAISSIYDKGASLKEGAGKSPFIVTGMTAQDLDVVGEKYYGNQYMVTHGGLMSKYGNWTGAKTWRYRSDTNTLFWWGTSPDEDVREATLDWLATKHNVSHPRQITSAQYDPYSSEYTKVKNVMHYPWSKAHIKEDLGIEADAFYVVGIITDNLNVVAKRYNKRDNYIIHADLRRYYGLDKDDGTDWRYHSIGNWIFWWNNPTTEQRDEVVNYLKSKFGVRNPKHEDPSTMEVKEAVSPAKRNYILVGLANQDLQVVAVKDYGKPYEKGGGLEGGMLIHSIEHSQLVNIARGRGYSFYKDGDEAHWRYKSSNNTLYIYPDTPSMGSKLTPMMKDAILDYLHTKYNVVNPKISRDKDAYFMDGHFINEMLCEAGKKDFIIYGNVDDNTHEVHGVKKVPASESGNHVGWGKRWRYRSTIPNFIFWWEEPDEKDKEAVDFFFYKKYGIKITRHRRFFDFAQDWNRRGGDYDVAGYLHGVKIPKPSVNEVISEKDVFVGTVNTDDFKVVAQPLSTLKDVGIYGTHYDLKKKMGIPAGSFHEGWSDFRYRKDKNVVYTKGLFSDKEKEAVKFWLEKNLRVNTDGITFVDYMYDASISMKAHGIEEGEKFNPFKARKLQFVTYGGLSLTKQKGFDPEKLRQGSAKFHSPPAKRGIYAFVWPYVEKFLLGGGYADPKERGKGQRQRIQYVKDKDGNVITSDHPDYDKMADIQKNWSLTRKRPDAPGKESPDDPEFEWDKEFYHILYNNANRKKFSYNGPLWHHLKAETPQDKILDEKGEWIKTDMDTFIRSFQKSLHQNLTADREIFKGQALRGVRGGYGLDYLEVFIDQKI